MEKFILIRANMKHRKGTFIGFAVLMLIITMSFTVIMSVNDNLKNQLQEANKLADTGDFGVFIADQFANGELQKKILDNPYVDRIVDKPCISFIAGKANKEKLKYYLELVKASENASTFRVYNEQQNGFIESPEPLKKGEIYVPITFKTLYNCHVGDQVTINTKKGDEYLTVKAYVEDPFLGAYVLGVKEAFISDEDFEHLSSLAKEERLEKEPTLGDYHMIHIYQKQPKTMDVIQFKKHLNKDCQVINYSYANLSKDDSEEYTLMLTTIFGEILYVFVGLLFVIVLIVMGHSISTGIEMDYVNLGVLKSQGFSKKQLRNILSLQYLVAEVIGSAIGILLSIPMTYLLGSIFQDITGLLARRNISIGKCLLFTVLLLLLGGIFVYVKTAKVARISPMRAICGGREEVYFDQFGTMKIKKKRMTLRLALRQLTSCKRQYIGIVVIVAILTYFLMSVTIMTQGIEVSTVFEMYGGVKCDVKLEYNEYYDNERKEEIVDKVNQISKVTYALGEVNGYVYIDGIEYNSQNYDDPELFKSITKGRAPLYDNEILLTEMVAKTLGVGVGDKIKVANQDKEEEYMVSGLYITMVDAGKCVAMSLAGVQRIKDVQPHGGYLRVEDKEKLEEIVAMLNQDYHDVLTAKVADNTQGLTSLIAFCLHAVTIFIYTISFFFTFVVVSMVCKKTFLKERQDIGIYKAVGFTVRRLRLGFALRFFLVSVIGCTIGIFLSIAFNAMMMNYLLYNCGITNFRADFTFITLFEPSIIIAICFFIFSYLISYKIKKVAVRELVVD